MTACVYYERDGVARPHRRPRAALQNVRFFAADYRERAPRDHGQKLFGHQPDPVAKNIVNRHLAVLYFGKACLDVAAALRASLARDPLRLSVFQVVVSAGG